MLLRRTPLLLAALAAVAGGCGSRTPSAPAKPPVAASAAPPPTTSPASKPTSVVELRDSALSIDGAVRCGATAACKAHECSGVLAPVVSWLRARPAEAPGVLVVAAPSGTYGVDCEPRPSLGDFIISAGNAGVLWSFDLAATRVGRTFPIDVRGSETSDTSFHLRADGTVFASRTGDGQHLDDACATAVTKATPRAVAALSPACRARVTAGQATPLWVARDAKVADLFALMERFPERTRFRLSTPN